MSRVYPLKALEWSLAAAAFAAPLSVAGTNAALGLLTLSAAWAWRSGPGPREALAAATRGPVFRLLCAGAAWALLSALAAPEPARGLAVWHKELHKLWAFAALAAGLGAARRGPALAALVAGLAVAALVGVGQTVLLSGGEAGFVRARAFVHPVAYGEIMGLALLGAAAAFALAPRERRPRAAAALARLAAALLLNQTRAVLVALAAAGAVVAYESPRLRRALFGAALALAAAAAIWEIMPTGGRNLRTLLSADPRASAHRARFVLWDAALEMAGERPLTGVGPGGFRDAFEARRPAGELDKERVWGTAHNLYLHQLAERGVPGLLLLAALFWALFTGARRAWRERRDAPALWALAATAAFAVMNLTETAWQTEQVATFFLLCWLWGAGPRS